MRSDVTSVWATQRHWICPVTTVYSGLAASLIFLCYNRHFHLLLCWEVSKPVTNLLLLGEGMYFLVFNARLHICPRMEPWRCLLLSADGRSPTNSHVSSCFWTDESARKSLLFCRLYYLHNPVWHLHFFATVWPCGEGVSPFRGQDSTRGQELATHCPRTRLLPLLRLLSSHVRSHNLLVLKRENCFRNGSHHAFETRTAVHTLRELCRERQIKHSAAN